jgi:hypothetical protein
VRVLVLTSPGRFPTVVFDPGLWWGRVAAAGRHDLCRFSANYAWWRTLCSPRFKGVAMAPLGTLDRVRQQAEWWAQGIVLDSDAAAAGRSLSALMTPEPFLSASHYTGALAPLARYLADANRAQSEFAISAAAGPRVNDLDYTDSATLVRYSEHDSLLSRSIAVALEDCPADLDVLALNVTSPEDLLTALIVARHLRTRNPGIHISLIDHGYENFSLHAQIEPLRRAGSLETVFDTIIASKDARDDLVPALIDALAQGQTVAGFLTRASLQVAARIGAEEFYPPPPLPTFVPEPILWMRLSARRCYWSKCNYCTQNSKYENARAPARSEILTSLDRIEACIAVGYRYFYFSDEALSPSTLRLLADEIDRRRMKFYWACRCKLERAHNAELFDRLGRSGCYEILYGLETTSARVLKLMDKYVEGLDEARMAEVFREMEAAGIGIHVNLIGGYPGDTLVETRQSVDFLIRAFAKVRGGTYVLNRFAMLADTPIAGEPNRYGVARVSITGDLAQSHEFELMPHIASDTNPVLDDIERLRRLLDDDLGWSRLGVSPEGALATELYFGSGHGSIFKARSDNPFANPLLDATNRRASISEFAG